MFLERSVLTLFLFFSVIEATYKTETRDGQQYVTVNSPTFSEEEDESLYMPKENECDGCKAVAFQVHQAFTAAEKKFSSSSKKPLRESDRLETMENVCAVETFKMYKIVEIGGKNLLTGPGIVKKQRAGEPVMSSTGGRWPDRLETMCVMFLGELDDEELYEAYRDSENIKEFTKILCNDMRKYCRNKKDEL